jgi:hypothetical protein
LGGRDVGIAACLELFQHQQEGIEPKDTLTWPYSNGLKSKKKKNQIVYMCENLCSLKSKIDN